ncbi:MULTISPECIES: hypothetical protein [unclassified Clostridium]|uniref:hypothetical protein n=1 Tax=unclassified Clostridium TaxID=2614128 RepID=UPI0025C0C17C|nr:MULTISPECIES: hypothetical protein [unclassified Clostridium]
MKINLRDELEEAIEMFYFRLLIGAFTDESKHTIQEISIFYKSSFNDMILI